MEGAARHQGVWTEGRGFRGGDSITYRLSNSWLYRHGHSAVVFASVSGVHPYPLLRPLPLQVPPPPVSSPLPMYSPFPSQGWGWGWGIWRKEGVGCWWIEAGWVCSVHTDRELFWILEDCTVMVPVLWIYLRCSVVLALWVFDNQNRTASGVSDNWSITLYKEWLAFVDSGRLQHNDIFLLSTVEDGNTKISFCELDTRSTIELGDLCICGVFEGCLGVFCE